MKKKEVKQKQFYSEEYLEQLRLAHKLHKWGGSAVGKIQDIVYIMKILNITDILDYGSGYGCLKEEIEKLHADLNLNVIEYDPGILDKSSTPKPCDLVVCFDVLEHIEPEFVDNVLDDLVRVTKKIGHYGISLETSTKFLPNGQNTHLSVHPVEWWEEKLIERFDILKKASSSTYCKYILRSKTYGK